jgi:hypothetical protein
MATGEKVLGEERFNVTKRAYVAKHSIEEEMPKLIEQLEDEFRKLLGVEE